MGYTRHHAIIITTWEGAGVAAALRNACLAEYVGAGGQPGAMSPLVGPLANDQFSFAIFPDGGNEGWEASDAGDRGRNAVKELLRSSRRPSGFEPDWAEVIVGSDEGEYHIIDHRGMGDDR